MVCELVFGLITWYIWAIFLAQSLLLVRYHLIAVLVRAFQRKGTNKMHIQRERAWNLF